jgi:hypothetical protein
VETRELQFIERNATKAHPDKRVGVKVSALHVRGEVSERVHDWSLSLAQLGFARIKHFDLVRGDILLPNSPYDIGLGRGDRTLELS